MPVTSGVPQGSVLGPVFFVIYINGIDLRLNNFISKFADYTKMGNVVLTECDRRSLQDDLRKISDWSVKWEMPFNLVAAGIMFLKGPSKREKWEKTHHSRKPFQIIYERICDQFIIICFLGVISWQKCGPSLVHGKATNLARRCYRVNINKCQILQVRFRNIKKDYDMCGVNVKGVYSVKNLGVTVRLTLSFPSSEMSPLKKINRIMILIKIIFSLKI